MTLQVKLKPTWLAPPGARLLSFLQKTGYCVKWPTESNALAFSRRSLSSSRREFYGFAAEAKFGFVLTTFSTLGENGGGEVIGLRGGRRIKVWIKWTWALAISLPRRRLDIQNGDTRQKDFSAEWRAAVYLQLCWMPFCWVSLGCMSRRLHCRCNKNRRVGVNAKNLFRPRLLELRIS
jgi:hypothetical protein